MQVGEGTIRAGERTIIAGHLVANFEYKIIIKMNLTFMVFIREMIYLK